MFSDDYNRALNRSTEFLYDYNQFMKKNMNMSYVPSIRRVRQKTLNSSNHQNHQTHQHHHQHSHRHHNMDVVDWEYGIKRHRDRELDRELKEIERQREWEKEILMSQRARRSRPRYRRSSPYESERYHETHDSRVSNSRTNNYRKIRSQSNELQYEINYPSTSSSEKSFTNESEREISSAMSKNSLGEIRNQKNQSENESKENSKIKLKAKVSLKESDDKDSFEVSSIKSQEKKAQEAKSTQPNFEELFYVKELKSEIEMLRNQITRLQTAQTSLEKTLKETSYIKPYVINEVPGQTSFEQQFPYDQLMAPFYSYPANYQGLVSGVAGDNNVTVPSVNEKGLQSNYIDSFMQQIQAQNGVLYQPFFYPPTTNVDSRGQHNPTQLITKSNEKVSQAQQNSMIEDKHNKPTIDMLSQHNLKQSNNRNLIGAEQNKQYHQQQKQSTQPNSKPNFNLETQSSYVQHQVPVQTQQKIQKPQIEAQDLKNINNNGNQAIKDAKSESQLKDHNSLAQNLNKISIDSNDSNKLQNLSNQSQNTRDKSIGSSNEINKVQNNLQMKFIPNQQLPTNQSQTQHQQNSIASFTPQHAIQQTQKMTPQNQQHHHQQPKQMVDEKQKAVNHSEITIGNKPYSAFKSVAVSINDKNVTEQKQLQINVDYQMQLDTQKPNQMSPNTQLYQKLLHLVSHSTYQSNEIMSNMNTLLSNPNIITQVKKLHSQLLKDPNQYLPQLENIIHSSFNNQNETSSVSSKAANKDLEKISKDLFELKNFYLQTHLQNNSIYQAHYNHVDQNKNQQVSTTTANAYLREFRK